MTQERQRDPGTFTTISGAILSVEEAELALDEATERLCSTIATVHRDAEANGGTDAVRELVTFLYWHPFDLRADLIVLCRKCHQNFHDRLATARQGGGR